ncbi:MAG: aldo/keto reductase [Candidatus Latescibacteria bacterium]|nr:aldo/keto reductase [Candidatus Latescibacterota bacterium]
MANQLPQILLGRTGLKVTRLGIGGAYCETPEGYRAALDCGVNYVDTARAYREGKDEEVIGRALQGRRHQLVLATKTAQRDAAGARQDLETSLRLLQTDYLDVWQIHHLNTQEEREKTLGPGGAMEAVEKARKEGLVRFVGVTGHDWVQIQAAVATGLFDTVLCWYNCAMKEPEQTVLPEAQKQNTGVVIMNASRNTKLFGGEDAPARERFYRYVLSHPAVHLTVMGLRDVEVFRQISQALAGSLAISPREKAELETYGAALRATGKLD